MNAVVFDMDGLMFNSEDIYTLAGAELLRRRGREFTAELKDAMMGIPPRESFEIMIRHHGLPESWDVLARESNEIFLALLPEHLALMPGLLELLDALEKAGTAKAIATSSGRRLTDACLGPFDLARRFQFVLTSEDITHGKPHPEIYLTAAKRFGVPPSRMIVLEDSQNGCRSGAAAGAGGGGARPTQPVARFQRRLAGGRQPGRSASLRPLGPEGKDVTRDHVAGCVPQSESGRTAPWANSPLDLPRSAVLDFHPSRRPFPARSDTRSKMKGVTTR